MQTRFTPLIALVLLLTACGAQPAASIPKVISFSVTPADAIAPGQAVTVSWEALASNVVLHYTYHTTSSEILFGDTLLVDDVKGSRMIIVNDPGRDDIETIEFSIQAYGSSSGTASPAVAEYLLMIPVASSTEQFATLSVSPTPVPTPPTGGQDATSTLKACTAMACEDRIIVRFGGTAPERYTVELAETGGETITFGCNNGEIVDGSYRSSLYGEDIMQPAIRWMTACKADRFEDTSGFYIGSFTPAEVMITIRWQGKSFSQKVNPDYQVVQPNGPGCEPICKSAEILVTLDH